MATSDGKERGSGLEESPMLRDIAFRYMPLAGGASSLLFSTNVMNPRMFRSLFSDGEYFVANCLWFNAHIGVGLYIYSRKHMARAATFQRIMYSVYGSLVFNFSSVLFWATTKALLPRCNYTRCLFGLGTGVAFLVVGKEYLKFVDSQVGNTLKE